MENITLQEISTTILFFVSLLGGIAAMHKYIKNWLSNNVIPTIKEELKPVIEESKSNKEASKCLLRSNITSKYYVYSQLGEIPMYEKENCNYMHEQYKQMGGNSYVDKIMEEINKLPIKK